MGTPNRTNILLDLNTTLNTISTNNGYNTDIDTVEQFVRGRDDVPSGQRPYVGFGCLEDERPEHFAFGEIRVVMPVIVMGLVNQATWTTRSAAVNNLADDIIAAVMSDPTRSNYAITTTFTGMLTDEGDPDAGPSGGACVLRFEIPYYRTTSSS